MTTATKPNLSPIDRQNQAQETVNSLTAALTLEYRTAETLLGNLRQSLAEYNAALARAAQDPAAGAAVVMPIPTPLTPGRTNLYIRPIDHAKASKLLRPIADAMVGVRMKYAADSEASGARIKDLLDKIDAAGAAAPATT
ncbi:MAG: hypothetical protein K8T25_06695 [Planctomycetia bacterium]|nr:hypothetical protein [Planctomycetia bacterium]